MNWPQERLYIFYSVWCIMYIDRVPGISKDSLSSGDKNNDQHGPCRYQQCFHCLFGIVIGHGVQLVDELCHEISPAPIAVEDFVGAPLPSIAALAP